MNRRRHRRFYVSVPIECQVSHGSVDSWSSQAVLKNISRGGLYFTSEAPPSLKHGDIADFIFKFLENQPNPLATNEIRSLGKVKRIEHPSQGSSSFGIVVEFLPGPLSE